MFHHQETSYFIQTWPEIRSCRHRLDILDCQVSTINRHRNTLSTVFHDDEPFVQEQFAKAFKLWTPNVLFNNGFKRDPVYKFLSNCALISNAKILHAIFLKCRISFASQYITNFTKGFSIHLRFGFVMFIMCWFLFNMNCFNDMMCWGDFCCKFWAECN